ncbi:MAG: hydrogen gas-evolving membrane-bound hydrogenase subunit E [Burkholderiaceae bacterium]
MALLPILYLSFAGIVIGYCLARLPGKWTYLSALVPAGLFLAFLSHLGTTASGQVITDAVNWVPSLGVELSLRLDGFAMLFALLITGIGALVTLYATAYFAESPPTQRARFVTLIMVFMTAMLGTVLSDNLIVMFVFWEATSLTSFLLIGFEATKTEARRAALQSLFVTGGGGLALFGAILLIGMQMGTFSLSEVTARASELTQSPHIGAIIALILLGAFTKSAQFPFHFWLPQAMAAPTPASAYLHSATMVKLGIYLLARFDSVFVDVPAFGITLVIFGTLTMAIAALNAIRATGYKSVLAQSTVASLGILVMLIGMGGPIASVAVTGFILSHALYKAALFFCAGTVIHATHIPELRKLGGLARFLPLTATAAILASLSMAGLPPFLGFTAKEYLFEAQLESSWNMFPVIVAVIVNGVMVAVAAAVSLRPFFRGKGKISRVHHGETAAMLAGPLLLGTLGIVLGALPDMTAQSIILPAAVALHGASIALTFSLWHGVTPMLLLSVTVVALGVALTWKWEAFHRKVNASLLVQHLDANRIYYRCLNGLLGLARRCTHTLQNGDQHRYTLIVCTTLLATAAYAMLRSGGVLTLSWSGGAVLPVPAIVLALGVVGAIVAARARSLVTALLGVGVFGYGSALLFLLNGAPDLALTQFAVETLVLVVLMAILVRLPTAAPPTRSTRERRVDVVVSAAFALLAFIGLASMTAQPFDTRLSDFYGATSYLQAFGQNVVNVIIVDYRALDTLGEIAVVGFATLAVWAMLRRRSTAKGN